MSFFKLLFCDEGHLYGNCLFDILTIYLKFHRFHFFSRGIRMYIPILRGIQNGCQSLRKNGHILLKIALVEALFLKWRTIVSEFLLDILTIYFKCNLFQFFSHGIYRYIRILTRVQTERKSHQKDCFFC